MSELLNGGALCCLFLDALAAGLGEAWLADAQAKALKPILLSESLPSTAASNSYATLTRAEKSVFGSDTRSWATYKQHLLWNQCCDPSDPL